MPATIATAFAYSKVMQKSFPVSMNFEDMIWLTAIKATR